MSKYYVNTNAQANGDHEVHKEECAWMPHEQHKLYLGDFSNCQDAVRAAKKMFTQSNGCYYCSKECNTG